MIQLTQGGAYLVNGTDIVADTPEAAREIQAKSGIADEKGNYKEEHREYIIQLMNEINSAL